MSLTVVLGHRGGHPGPAKEFPGMTTPYFPSDYEGGPALPLVPHVEYPSDLETDRQLHEVERAAIRVDDPRARAEAQLDLAHRAMVYRDALLGQLVNDVQNGNGDAVLNRALLYAFWHGVLERNVEEAADNARRLRDRAMDREAGR